MKAASPSMRAARSCRAEPLAVLGEGEVANAAVVGVLVAANEVAAHQHVDGAAHRRERGPGSRGDVLGGLRLAVCPGGQGRQHLALREREPALLQGAEELARRGGRGVHDGAEAMRDLACLGVGLEGRIQFRERSFHTINCCIDAIIVRAQ